PRPQPAHLGTARPRADPSPTRPFGLPAPLPRLAQSLIGGPTRRRLSAPPGAQTTPQRGFHGGPHVSSLSPERRICSLGCNACVRPCAGCLHVGRIRLHF